MPYIAVSLQGLYFVDIYITKNIAESIDGNTYNNFVWMAKIN